MDLFTAHSSMNTFSTYPKMTMECCVIGVFSSLLWEGTPIILKDKCKSGGGFYVFYIAGSLCKLGSMVGFPHLKK